MVSVSPSDPAATRSGRVLPIGFIFFPFLFFSHALPAGSLAKFTPYVLILHEICSFLGRSYSGDPSRHVRGGPGSRSGGVSLNSYFPRSICCPVKPVLSRASPRLGGRSCKGETRCGNVVSGVCFECLNFSPYRTFRRVRVLLVVIHQR